MKKKLAIVFGCLAVIAAAVFGILLGRAYYDRKKPNFSGLFELYVYPDMTPEAVLDSILSTGKVIKPNSLKRAFERRKELFYFYSVFISSRLNPVILHISSVS